MPKQVRLFLTLVFLCLVGVAGGAVAQLTDRQSEYYRGWIKTADRAESVIEANRASNAGVREFAF